MLFQNTIQSDWRERQKLLKVKKAVGKIQSLLTNHHKGDEHHKGMAISRIFLLKCVELSFFESNGTLIRSSC